jgi:hypothetical protein
MDEHRFDEERFGSPHGWLGDGAAASPPPPARLDATDPAVEVQHQIDRLTDVARAKAAAVAVAEAELVDAVAALRPYEGKYLATWRQWVAWRCGLTSSEAARICRLADKLVGLPRIDDALRTGQLSAGVTDVLASVATPANEAEVLATAQVATGRQLQQVVRDFRQARRSTARPKPGEDAIDPATAPSELSYGWRDDGRFHGHWNLRPDEGGTVEAALEAALAHLRPTEAEIDEHTITEGSVRETEKPTRRRSDALVGLANTFLADEADDGLLPESTQIILHRNLTPTGTRRADGALIPDLPDLRVGVVERPGRHGHRCDRCGHRTVPRSSPPTHHDDHDPGHDDDHDVPTYEQWLAATTLPGCGTLDPRIAELLCCGALVITVDMIAGFPVSAPIAQRPFNRAQRRAMRARDRHCRFPGCARTRHLHAHHTKPYAATHRTTIADGLLLCGQHHLLVHLRGYTITLGTDHQVTVTRSDGTVLRGAALPPPDTVDQPSDIPADRRLTGTADPLTYYARDVLVEHWLNAGSDPREPPEPPDPSEPPGPRDRTDPPGDTGLDACGTPEPP